MTSPLMDDPILHSYILMHTGHGGHIRYRRPLRGKINVNVLNSRYLLDGPLQIDRAVDTGHAGNGKGEMGLIGHWGANPMPGS